MWSGNVSAKRGARRRARVARCGAAAALLLADACSGQSQTIFEEPGAPRAGEAGEPGLYPPSAGTGGAGAAGRGGGSGTDAGPDADASDGDAEPFVDPGCPDAAPPAGVVECDPFSVPSGCFAGDGCYPDLTHPFGSGCDQQTLSVVCKPAGIGVQGDLCGLGTGNCAPGYICVVGAGAGKRCLRLCAPDGSTPCPAGYVCGETDAHGFGVCA